jgi:hypothetical protein
MRLSVVLEGRYIVAQANKDSWDFPAKSQSNSEQNKSYQSFFWVTTASSSILTPLSSNMTWLKGPKVDQWPNLIYRLLESQYKF